MKIGQQIRFIVINQQANSLHSLIADGVYRATSLGRDTWKSLIGSQGSLQRYCNKEGFNVEGNIANSKARIGIIGNEQSNCGSPDSRIGFGTGGYPETRNTCGNEAKHGGDNGNKQIRAMGYILVQWKALDDSSTFALLLKCVGFENLLIFFILVWAIITYGQNFDWNSIRRTVVAHWL